MIQNFSTVQKLSQDRLTDALKAFGTASTGTKVIVAETTYGIAANLGRWNREALECAKGTPRRPRSL
jgi:hypothetical protein